MDNVILLSTPKFSENLLVIRVVDVHLTLFVILKLRVVYSFLWDGSASEKPNTHDFEVWFFAKK